MKVLITGTSGGIGKAIAEKFISLGHEVIGIDKEASQLINDRYTHFVADIARVICLTSTASRYSSTTRACRTAARTLTSISKALSA